MAKLRVHNIEPSTGTDVAFGTSGDTIAVSSDSLKLNVWKDSGGNTLFQSDGAGTLSNINSSFSGAGPKLILSQTATNSATISFTSDIDSTYDHYMFVFTNINPVTDAAELSFQVNASGESGYNETMTTTFFMARHEESGSSHDFGYQTSMDQANGTAFQVLMDNIGNGADESAAGILHLFNPASTTYVKHFYSRFSTYTQSNRAEDSYVAGYINVTTAIDEIQFKMSTGNFDGTIKMYGVA